MGPKQNLSDRNVKKEKKSAIKPNNTSQESGSVGDLRLELASH